jgi:hypothetical protein
MTAMTPRKNRIMIFGPKPDGAKPFPGWAIFLVAVYAGLGLRTLGLQTYVRGSMFRQSSVRISVAKAVVWSTVWPAYWAVYAADFYPERRYRTPMSIWRGRH